MSRESGQKLRRMTDSPTDSARHRISEDFKVDICTCSYNGIDLVKFICSFLVCMIHIDPFPEDALRFGKYLNYGLQQYVCRLAVPFFFICSGFFLFRKTELYKPDCDKVKKYCFKLACFLGIWSILLFKGGTGHLWYIKAMVVAMALLTVLLHKNIKLRYLALIAVVLYVIGLLGDSYYGLVVPFKDVNITGKIMNGYKELFDKTRNGVFMGFIFVLMGAVFAHKRIVMNMKLAVSGFAVSMILLFMEVTALVYFDIPKDYNMYFFLLPASFFLFYIASNVKLKDSRVYVRLRGVGVLIYYLHMLMKFLVTRMLESLKGHTGIDASPYIFIIVIVCVTAIAVLIEYLSHKEKLKWLQWLYK